MNLAAQVKAEGRSDLSNLPRCQCESTVLVYQVSSILFERKFISEFYVTNAHCACVQESICEQQKKQGTQKIRTRSQRQQAEK
jgi:hypothetical protein